MIRAQLHKTAISTTPLTEDTGQRTEYGGRIFVFRLLPSVFRLKLWAILFIGLSQCSGHLLRRPGPASFGPRSGMERSACRPGHEPPNPLLSTSPGLPPV